MKRRAISIRPKHRMSFSAKSRRQSLDQILQEWSWLREAMSDAEAPRDRDADFDPVGYLTLDRNGCIRDINLTGARLLCRTRSGLVGYPLLNMIEKHDRLKYLEHLRRMRHGEPRTLTELTFAPWGGKPFIAQLLSVPSRSEGAQAPHFRTALFDVSDRKRAEAGLQESEERRQAEAALRRTHDDLEYRVAERSGDLSRINQRLRVEITERRQAEGALRASEQAFADFFEHATIGMQWLDRRGRVLRINQAALDIFGCSRDDCLHRAIAPFFVDQNLFAELLDRINLGETLRDFSARLQRADGSIRHLLIDADGSRHKRRLVHTRWFIRDITERVLLQAEIVRASDRERQRIGQDLHDGLCQLLTGIRWKSQSLQQRLDLSAPAEAGRVRKITGLLTDAIKQARGVVRGLQPVESVPDGLMSALQQLASSTRDLFGVACQCDVVPPVLVSEPSAATDLFRIAQEAINNAIKHGRARKIRINLAQNNGDILLTITNDGRPFPRRSRTSGVGLGIMQNRARRIGAALQLSVGARGGTVVTCSMPVSEAGRTEAANS